MGDVINLPASWLRPHSPAQSWCGCPRCCRANGYDVTKPEPPQVSIKELAHQVLERRKAFVPYDPDKYLEKLKKLEGLENGKG